MGEFFSLRIHGQLGQIYKKENRKERKQKGSYFKYLLYPEFSEIKFKYVTPIISIFLSLKLVNYSDCILDTISSFSFPNHCVWYFNPDNTEIETKT